MAENQVHEQSNFRSPAGAVTTGVAVSAVSRRPFDRNLIVDLSFRVIVPEIYFNYTFQLAMIIRFSSSEINVKGGGVG